MVADQKLALLRLASAHRAVAAISAFAPCAMPALLVLFGYNVKALAGYYGVAWLLASPVFAVLLLLATRFIERVRHRRFVMGVAALSLVYFPLGTLLGFFTLMQMRRLDMKAAFDRGESGIPDASGCDQP